MSGIKVLLFIKLKKSKKSIISPGQGQSHFIFCDLWPHHNRSRTAPAGHCGAGGRWPAKVCSAKGGGQWRCRGGGGTQHWPQYWPQHGPQHWPQRQQLWRQQHQREWSTLLSLSRLSLSRLSLSRLSLSLQSLSCLSLSRLLQSLIEVIVMTVTVSLLCQCIRQEFYWVFHFKLNVWYLQTSNIVISTCKFLLLLILLFWTFLVFE